MPPVPPSPPGAPGRLPRASVKQAAGSSCSAPEAAGHSASVSGLLPPRPPSRSVRPPRFWPASVRHSSGVVGPSSPAPAAGHSCARPSLTPGISGTPPSPPPGRPGRPPPRASLRHAAGSSCSAAEAVGHTASVSGLLPPRPPSMSWMLLRFWPASVRHSIGVVGPISPAPASGHSWPSSCSPPGSGLPPSPPGSGTPPGRPSRASMKQAAGSRPSSDVTGHRASVSGLPPSRPPSARPPSRPSRSPKPPPSSSRQSNGVVGPISSPAVTGQMRSRAMPAPGICGAPPPGAEGS